MTSALQSGEPGPGRRQDDDDQDLVTLNDRAEGVEEADEPETRREARRRASLNKEIRAGWQRALGH